MKDSKQNKKDTSKIPDIYQVLRDNLISDKNISIADFKLRYEDDIKALDELFKLQKKEERGAGIFAILLISILLGAAAVLYFGYKKLNNYEWKANMLDKIMVESIDSLKDKGIDEVTYKTKDGKLVTYWELASEKDSIKQKLDSINSGLNININTLNNTIKEQSIGLDLIRRNYNIEIKKNYKKNSVIYSVYAPHIDSALMLLPRYRSRLHYDKDNDRWYTKDSE